MAQTINVQKLMSIGPRKEEIIEVALDSGDTTFSVSTLMHNPELVTVYGTSALAAGVGPFSISGRTVSGTAGADSTFLLKVYGF